MMLDRLPIFPYGVKISLTWLQVAAHLDAIERFNIGLFVELGILHGGLTSILWPGVQRGLYDYLGVEINPAFVDPIIAQNSQIIYGNCFSSDIKQQVKQTIDRSRRPVLLFCDNGHKPREVVEYAPLLRSGDYLSVHDYNTEIFDKDLDCLTGKFDPIEEDWRKAVIKMPLYRKL